MLLLINYCSYLTITSHNLYSPRAPPAGAHHLAADFSSALRLVESELADQADQVWIIGGSSLYKELMERPGTKRLFVTRILKQFDCDTFLPQISPGKYHLLFITTLVVLAVMSFAEVLEHSHISTHKPKQL
uniref:dihydrofolate reductase n=1 Tax=Seriola lalandi dorsalis TaxID=1841481 RepID=A0A3B4X5P7_SERLL